MKSKDEDGTRHSGELIALLTGRRPARNLHSDVLWRLGIGIVSGRYPENAILPTDSELLAEFGVSRTVLREALKTLAAKGMIEARARIGTRVLPRERWNLFDADVLAWHFELGPDLGFLRSLAEVRIGIEIEAAALAAERRTEAQAEQLLALAEQLGHATSAEDFARRDMEFHRAVALISANPFMASISALVELALTASFAISSPMNVPGALEGTALAHGRIAQAIADGQADAAREAMRAVISEGISRAADQLADAS